MVNAQHILIGAIAAGILAAAASAQDDPASPGTPPAPPALPPLEYAPEPPDFPLWDFRVGADGLATTEADFSSGPGSVRTWVAGAGAGATITISPKLQFRIDGRAEYRNYDFAGATRFDPVNGDPFDSLYRAYADGLGLMQINDRWSLAFGARIASQGETDADVNETFTGRLYAAPLFKVNDDLTIGVGIVAQSRLEERPLIAPAPIVNYRLNETYSFHFNALEGAELRYTASEAFLLALEFDWGFNEYRLSDDGFARDGVFRETAVRLGLHATWRPTPRLDLMAGIGSFVWQEWELRDIDGDELSQDTLAPSGYATVGFQYRF